MLPKNKEEKKCVHFHQGHFEILVISKPKLLFLIPLNTCTKYVFLFTVEQLNLNPENILLELIGSIDQDSDYYKIATYMFPLIIDVEDLRWNNFF
jgi:hypothetical protein